MIAMPQLDGWVPIRLYWQDQTPMIDWCYLNGARFTEPFFGETVQRSLRSPFNLLFRHQTSVEVLLDWQQRRPGLVPAGFIFHVSRCGSTLLAQMLAALPANIVISEAGVIDSIIRANLHHPATSETQRIAWLRAVISALGQPRLSEQRLFIKFDAWNVIDLALVRRAFPTVPWILLFRDPVEVLVSQMARRGSQMIPGVHDSSLYGMDPITALTVSPEEFCARVLGSVFEAALNHIADGGRLINYHQLPNVLWEELVNFFGTSFSEGEIEGMRSASRADAKNPSAMFTSDKERKRQSATAKITEMAERWCYPAYERLEAARLTSRYT